MKCVAFYSNTGECKNIAQYLSEKSGCGIVDISAVKDDEFEDLILVFPVYCQNIPEKVKDFLSRIKCRRLIAIAVYGKMSFGNVLREIRDNYPHKISAAAYVPAKHSYLDEERFSRFSELDVLTDAFSADGEVFIPKEKKSFWADFMAGGRSRMGVRLIKKDNCTECGLCTENCPEKAMVNGKAEKNCIRCLKCVYSCPEKALEFRLIYPLKVYLSKKRCDRLIIYIQDNVKEKI